MDPNAPVTNAPRPPWPRAWTWAIVLAVGMLGMHATLRWWGASLAQALFGDLPPTPAEAPPLLWALLAGYLILSWAGGLGIAELCTEGSLVRDRHRWQYEEAERQRLQQIRDQLWLESLPEPDRERVLARPREERELERRAEAILAAERRGDADGR